MARFLRETGTLIQHIPRCAGTWVERAIDALKLNRMIFCERQPGWIPNKHALLNHYHRDTHRINRTAIFVRHPVAYYSSVWRWLIKQPNRYRQLMLTRWDWHPKARAIECFDADFNIWADRMLTKHPLWMTRLVDWYVGPPGGEFVDYIGRVESVLSDFQELILFEGYHEAWETHGDKVKQMEPQNSAREVAMSMSDEIRGRIMQTERDVVERFYGHKTADKRFYWRSDPEHAERFGYRPVKQETETAK